MKQAIIISTDQHKARAKMVIDSLPLDVIHKVSIAPHKRNRSAEQNAYMWLVETIMGSELGLTKDAMHEVHKSDFLVPIFVRDDHGYADMYFAVESAPEPQRTILKREVVKLTSTTKADVAQMSEFIDSIIQQAGELGIRLPQQEY
jgi:hypothetical protein